jgi:shikimate dehydrogenase
MNIYGLIGYPLSHSFSATLFSEYFFREGIKDSRFELFPIENINDLIPLINNIKELKGLSITIPYKSAVIPVLTHIDPIAREIGAVNNIKIIRENNIALHGFNTDVFGFEESIKPLLNKNHCKALILGTGGSSKAVAYVLRKLGIEYSFVTRIKKDIYQCLTYQELNDEIVSNHLLIVNATPAGMFPNISEMPDIPYNLLTKNHLLFDLIYNPAETTFLKKGIEKGCSISNGSKMLWLQAMKSWQIWNE